MKLAQFVFVGMLLHLAVTSPVEVVNPSKVSIAYDNHQDPQLWQKSGKIEGDMVLTPDQQERLYKDTENRSGVIDTRLRWPNRIIPYEFSNHFDSSERNYIEKVLAEEYARTCVRVVPRTNEIDHVYITGRDTGCWSSVGRLGGRQELNLQRLFGGCMTYKTIVHEFLHTAGFYHQQSAAERDDYVTIQWENIQYGKIGVNIGNNQSNNKIFGKEDNFYKYGSNMVSNFGERYDYGSIMHSDAYAFSSNGLKTMVPKHNVEMGSAPDLSRTDIAKLNKMYGC